jgi:predicted tellurium resistance membrane protein TerC
MPMVMMNGWAWQMALWMIGATILWIALIALVAWLVARWETRTLQRVNISMLEVQHAHLAHVELEAAARESHEGVENAPEPETSASRV